MQYSKILALASLAGQSLALLATFDQANINLSNYMSASYTNLSIVTQQNAQAVQPQSSPSFVQSSPQTGGGSGPPTGPATGTLLLNTHSSSGHLTNYYFACFSPAEFVHESQPCNLTMKASCYNKSNQLQVFTLVQQYLRSDNKMDLIDLAGFYNFYGQGGYFTGNGSTAKCTQYVFNAVQKTAGTVPISFYLDSMTYSVNA